MSHFLVQRYLEEGAARAAQERPAVVDSNAMLSYAELARATNRLARGLREAGIRGGDRVAFCLERSTRPVVAVLGILKSGAAYVPVHRKTPPERMAAVFKDCAPCAVVCDSATLAHVRSAIALSGGAVRIVLLGASPAGALAADPDVVFQRDIDALDDAPLDCDRVASSPAYLLYTSGSTGHPKGVIVTHQNIRDYIDWAAREFAVGAEDRVLGTAPFSFDMSTFDIFCPLKCGAALYIAPEAALVFPVELVRFMERHRVTIWKGVSSLLMYMARTGAIGPARVPSLRTVIFAGEVLPTKYLMEWMRTFPDKTFYNAYGPTETTGVSACYRIPVMPDKPDDPIPIGKPRDRTTLLVLDEKRMPVPAGQPGEICIGGAGVSPGYWNDEDLSRRAFCEITAGDGAPQRAFMTGDLGVLRADGHCLYLGRTDAQVKIMGYRIELGDIERVLSSVGWVRDAAVVVRPTEHAEMPELVAFVELDGTRAGDDVAAELAAHLPPYMIPRRVVTLPRLPRTDRGKIDRQLLMKRGLGDDAEC
ncbi:MAG: amino acid adenylation domain-containing protein [Acidobacteriia bacterium]|nr:amino acid adenylation domain-containing protein [Terriglobia bacterium]